MTLPITWRPRSLGVAGVAALCVVALSVTSFPANAAPAPEPSGVEAPSPSPAPSPEPGDDPAPAPTPSPSPEPSPSPSPELPGKAKGNKGDAAENPHKRVDVPSQDTDGLRQVGSGRLDNPAPQRVAPPPFATDTFHALSPAELKASADVGERPGNSLVVGVGAPEPEVNYVELSPGKSAKLPGFFDNPAAHARANRKFVEPGGVVSVSQFPGASDGFVSGSAFGLRVTAGRPGADAQWVDVALDVSSVDGVFGANYVDRLDFVLLPECVLERPDDPECLTALPLDVRRDGDRIVTVTVPANARSIEQAARGFNVGSSSSLSSADVAAAFASSRGLKFEAPSGGTIVAAVSGAQGQTGDFAATDLAPKGSWGVSEQSGAFTYSVPVAAPPAQFGPVPSISLSYSSASTDGRTENTNGQTSLLGEGWASPTNYIERHYISCYDDKYETSQGHQDRCWQSPYTGVPGEAAYTVSLNGATYDLIWDGDNRYRTDTEIGWRITRHTRDGVEEGPAEPGYNVGSNFGEWPDIDPDLESPNGDNNGEYFLVQTPDGSRYYFGYGTVGEDGEPTNSVATVPVFGDDDGEPQCGATENGECVQGYRWMLDITVDPSSNAMVNYYTQEINYYSVKGKASREEPYTRAINPDRIEYGLVWDGLATGVDEAYEAQAMVEFSLVDRCVELADYHGTLAHRFDEDDEYACPQGGMADYDNVNSYPDVPVDLMCSGSCPSALNSPTFFTTKRLDQINTYVRDWGNEITSDPVEFHDDWVPVDTTQMVTAFPATGDGSARNLWLDSVYTHAWGAYDDESDELDTYLIKFDPIQLNNRVDFIPNDSDRRAVDRLRIERVRTEFGGHIEVEYAVKGESEDGVTSALLCPQGGVVDGTDSGSGISEDDAEEWYEDVLFPQGWGRNERLCFPSTSEDDSPTFHKYLVTQVRLIDAVAPIPQATGPDEYLTSYNNYDYKGEPAWVYSDDVLSDRDDLKGSWSVFRGFETVESYTGDRNRTDDFPVTKNQYYRGISEKFLDTGATGPSVFLDLLGAVEVTSDDPELSAPQEDLPELAGFLASTATFKRDGSDETPEDSDEIVSASHDIYTVERAVSLQEISLAGTYTNVDQWAGLGAAEKDTAPTILRLTADGDLYSHHPDGNGLDAGTLVSVAGKFDDVAQLLPAGDWNDDDRIDFMVLDDSHDFHVWNGNSASSFQQGQNIMEWNATKVQNRTVITGLNWDGDAHPDAMWVESTSDHEFRLREGVGSGPPKSSNQVAKPYDDTRMRFADYDGDGREDASIHVSSDWYASYSGNGYWWLQNTANKGPDDIRFDGEFSEDDDESDLLTMETGEGWKIRRSGEGSWKTLNGKTATSDMHFYDLDGDDVDEFVHHNGTTWRYLDGGEGDWHYISGVTTDVDVTFADTDGDGTYEILHRNGTQWDRWTGFDFQADTAQAPAARTGPDAGADAVLVGSFDATPGDDLIRFHDTGTGDYEWQVSSRFNGAWEKLIAAEGDDGNAAGEAEDAYDYDADFEYFAMNFAGADDRDDIVRYGDGGWAMLVDAQGEWTPIAAAPWVGYTRYATGGDLDGDGKGDIFGITATGEVFVHHSDGDQPGPATRDSVLTHVEDDETILTPGDWTGDGVNDVVIAKEIATEEFKLTLRVGAPRVSGGDGKHYAQIVRADKSWSMTQEKTDNTPVENADATVTSSTKRTWMQQSESTTVYDPEDFQPIADSSTVSEWVWTGTGDHDVTPDDSYTMCTAYDHVWGIRDASDALLGYADQDDVNDGLASAVGEPMGDEYADVAGWGGTTYINATWRTRSYEGGCSAEDPTAGTLTGVSEGYFDGADWSSTPKAQATLLKRGLPTMEVTYPEYDDSGSGTAETKNRANASLSVAEYDDFGRIEKAWTPEVVTVDEETGAHSVPTDHVTSWDYSPFGQLAAPDGRVLAATTVTTATPDLPTGGYSHTSWSEPTRGLTVMSEDINGLFTHYRYDAFGLLTEGYAPSDQHKTADVPWLKAGDQYVVPSVSFVYDVHAPAPVLRNHPVAVVTGKNMGFRPEYDDASTTVPAAWQCLEDDCYVNRSYTYMDGFGRVIEQHSPAPDGSGGRLATVTRYDGDGRTLWSAGPIPQADEASLAEGAGYPLRDDLTHFTEPSYDWAGRVEEETSVYVKDPQADPRVEKPLTTQTGYFGNITQAMAASGAITETKNDVQGRLVSQKRYPAAGSSEDAFETTYDYEINTGTAWVLDFAQFNAEGFSRVTVEDAEQTGTTDGNKTVFVQNFAGQRLAMVDPNAGLSMYKYDRNGQTTQVLSQTGLMEMTYDTLGNMTERETWTECASASCDTFADTWSGNDAKKSSSAAWSYDYAGSNGAPKGALIETTSTTALAPYLNADAVSAPPATPAAAPNNTFTLTQETVEWDDLYRPKQSKTTLPNVAELGELAGQSYARTVTYDDVGRATSTSPEIAGVLAEQVPQVEYNRFGMPTALSIINDPGGSEPSTTHVVSGIAQDELGRVTDRVYANDVVRSITFSDRWGAPSQISAWFVDGGAITKVQDDVFTRDDFGRVVEVNGAMDVTGTVRERQCFVYDGHNRLDQAWTLDPGAAADQTCDTGGDAAFDFPTAGTVAWNSSAAPYATDWDYSASGKITQITELVVIGAAASDEKTRTHTFAYGDASSVHAVTDVTITDDRTDPNPGPEDQVVADHDFEYDDAGRQDLRVVDGVTETLTWDVSSNLVSTVADDGTDTTTWSYLYDASGQRWAKIETPTKTGSKPQATVYLGDTEITDKDTGDNDATSDVTAVRYFTFGGATVAMVQAVEVEPFEPADDVPFFFLFGDYQGSAQVVMPDVRDPNTDDYDLAASAGAILRNAYTPYGATRAVGFGAGAAQTDDAQFERGWLSQVADETTATLGTGLTYLNARYYDPISSRFLSPDPLLDVMDPKTLDPYRYADNNPIVFTDATGLKNSCAGLSGDALTYCSGYTPDVGGSSGVSPKKPVPAPANLPADVCYQAGSPCWVGGAKAKTYQETQALDGIDVDPWANQVCYGDGWCDTGGMYPSTAPGPIDGHLLLDGCGMAPAVGGLCDGANAVWYGVEGDWANAALSMIAFIPLIGQFAGGSRIVAKTITGVTDRATDVAKFCSFSGDTEVLMADGTHKPIEDVEPGDVVWAVDPETGEAGPREVTHIWPHEDDLVEFTIGDDTVTTTEDHPFWNATDRDWQGPEEFESGDLVLTADGQLLATNGLVADSWTYGAAYNLTVDDLHTYFVSVGQADILVHNTGCTNIADLPNDAVRKLSKNQDYAFARLNENHGVTRIEFGDQVHAIKKANGLPGDFDLSFGPTGDVWNPLTGDLIGNIVHAG